MDPEIAVHFGLLVPFRERFGAPLPALRTHGDRARAELDQLRLGVGDSVVLPILTGCPDTQEAYSA
ncbi:MAG: hypothetical protein P8188_10445 [Gemmatimonadota bacterium]